MSRHCFQQPRPNLPEGEAKDVIVQTRISEADRELIQSAADSAGVKLAKWIRNIIVAAANSQSRGKS